MANGMFYEHQPKISVNPLRMRYFVHESQHFASVEEYLTSEVESVARYPLCKEAVHCEDLQQTVPNFFVDWLGKDPSYPMPLFDRDNYSPLILLVFTSSLPPPPCLLLLTSSGLSFLARQTATCIHQTITTMPWPGRNTA